MISVLSNVKRLYTDGKLVLTRNKVERLNKYLHPEAVIQASGQKEDPSIHKEIDKAKKRYTRILAATSEWTENK